MDQNEAWDYLCANVTENRTVSGATGLAVAGGLRRRLWREVPERMQRGGGHPARSTIQWEIHPRLARSSD